MASPGSTSSTGIDHWPARAISMMVPMPRFSLPAGQ